MSRWALPVLLLLFAPAVAAGPVHEYRLDNGLRVLVKEDHRAPVVVSQVWYKVGSGDEHGGITGISHALEHMMFQGTAKHPAGEFSRIVAANGGRENAFTGRDYTAYFQLLAKDRLPVSFELESDRMRNLSLKEADFRREIQVVMEERRLRTDDNPQALTYERFNAAAFVSSPYHHPVIGWMDDLRNLKIGDLRAWYRRWYAPNNATLVVVGDVDPQAVLRLAERYFGPLPAGRPIHSKPRRELGPRGIRRITVRAPAELPYLLMGYQVPVLRTARDAREAYALEVLAGILDGGSGARLASRLVRGEQVAASASAGYDLYARRTDLFLLNATPARGHGVADLERALRREVRRLREQPVTAAELERVKAQVVARRVFEQDSVFYQAMQLGRVVTAGLDPRVLDEYVDRIRAVTPARIQAVARRYLIPERLTVAVLDPLPVQGRSPRAAPLHGAGALR
ncbi:MAG TPA: insulinase family protein [Gammaproteobacteria bacterium]|nr:insulinase family protein [Gammaproteobacteria bacterium]